MGNRSRSWSSCLRRLAPVIAAATGLLGATVPPAAGATTQSASWVPIPAGTSVPVGPGVPGISTGGDIEGYGASLQQQQIHAIAKSGAHWIRLDAYWANVQAGPGSSYNWAEPDAVVGPALTDGLHVLLILDGVPAWARDATTGQPDPSYYADYGRAAAEHYGPSGTLAPYSVTAYELDNEPNYTGNWGGDVSTLASSYTAVARQFYSAIKGVQPGSIVLAGAIGTACCAVQTSGIPMPTFVQDLLNDGICSSMDALSVHPYTYPAYPDQPEYYNYFTDLPQFHQEMTTAGCGKSPIWISEMGVPTGTGRGAASPSVQASMLTQAYQQTAQWSFMGPLLWYQYKDLACDPSDTYDNFGLVNCTGAAKPALSAFEAVTSGS